MLYAYVKGNQITPLYLYTTRNRKYRSHRQLSAACDIYLPNGMRTNAETFWKLFWAMGILTLDDLD